LAAARAENGCNSTSADAAAIPLSKERREIGCKWKLEDMEHSFGKLGIAQPAADYDDFASRASVK
jgi:hypothetical protein